MLVRDKQSADERITSVNQSLWQRRLNFWRFAWERLVIFLSNKLDRKQLFRVSIANTGVDIARHPLVREADVIHLHWVNQGFLSLGSIRQLIATGKPIVWTMHDLWPASSICHYAGQCERYQASCGQCFYLHSSRKDLSSLIFRRKQRIYDQAQIAFVCCSQWLRGRAALSQLLRQQRLTAIPNPIDQSLYRSQERTAARKALGLPLDKPLLLFGALNINDERKGIDYLVEAELPFVVILTKADKLKKMARQARMEAFAQEIPYFSELTVIPFSSQTFEGVEQVRQIITELAEEGD